MNLKRIHRIKRRAGLFVLAATGAFVIIPRLDGATLITHDSPPQVSPDAQKAVDEAASAVAGKATKLQATWSFELQEGGEGLGQGMLSVKDGKWVLAVIKTPTTAPTTQPVGQPVVLFYGDQHYIYDLRLLTRYGYQGLSVLPNATLFRVLLANVEPSAVISTLGLPVYKSEERPADGHSLVSLRFEPPFPTTQGGAQVIRSSVPATDVLFDAMSNSIVSIRDVDMRSGAGRLCQWNLRNLQKDGSLPSVISTIEVQEDGKGRFNRVPDMDGPALRLASANTPDSSALLSRAEAQIQSAAFFATPIEALGALDENRRAADSNPLDLTAAAALAESMFSSGDLASGLSEWNTLDKKLMNAALRYRLFDILAPLAAEASRSAAATPSPKSQDLVATVLDKLSSATDARPWRQVSAEVFLPWEALRQQQTLGESTRLRLDHDILPRLCDSGNVSVYAALLRLIRSDPALQPVIDPNLDSAAAQRLQAQGYACSSLSAQVAAAILSDDLGRADRWLAGANWSKETPLASKEPRDAISVALKTGVTAKTGQDLGAVIVAYSRLDGKDLVADPSAAAARIRLLQIGARIALRSDADCVTPTASIGQAASYWGAALASQSRPSMNGSAAHMDEDMILRLANRYAKAFNKPTAVSHTLVMLSDRDRFTVRTWAVRRQRLNAALATAPDDLTRVFVVSHIVEFFKQLGEPDQAMAAVSSLLSKLQDPHSLQLAQHLAKDVERWRDTMSRRLAYEQTVVDNAGASFRLELASHASQIH